MLSTSMLMLLVFTCGGTFATLCLLVLAFAADKREEGDALFREHEFNRHVNDSLMLANNK